MGVFRCKPVLARALSRIVLVQTRQDVNVRTWPTTHNLNKFACVQSHWWDNEKVLWNATNLNVRTTLLFVCESVSQFSTVSSRLLSFIHQSCNAQSDGHGWLGATVLLSISESSLKSVDYAYIMNFMAVAEMKQNCERAGCFVATLILTDEASWDSLKLEEIVMHRSLSTTGAVIMV